MGKFHAVIGLSIVCLLAQVGWGELIPVNGLCIKDKTAQNLEKAICQFPSCLSGADCLSPTIDRRNSFIEFQEPWIQWTESCPSPHRSPCWQVVLDFNFKLGASDPAGVKEIGTHIMTVVDARPEYTKYWGTAESKDTLGRYQMTQKVVTYVPPGQRLELSVYELCARDRYGNDGCVLPEKVNLFNKQMR